MTFLLILGSIFALALTGLIVWACHVARKEWERDQRRLHRAAQRAVVSVRDLI